MTVGASDATSGIPQIVEARALPLGRLPFAFGQRFIVALVLGLAWLAPAWWSMKFVVAMFFWDALIVAAWLFDFSRLPRPRQITVRRVWSSQPALGVSSRIGIQIAGDSPRLLYIAALDETPLALAGHPPDLAAVVPPRGTTDISYPILPSQRGVTRVGRVFLRYRSTLGLAERRAVADLAQAVCVLPNIEQARRQTLRLIRSRQVEIERRRYRQRGMGRELESLREYREGDDFRDVSWTATARRRRLITRVFQMERSQTLWLVLDAGRLLRAKVQELGSALRLSKLDHAVNAALSLGQVAMQCGDRVGLLAYGAEIQQSLIPGRGAQHIRSLARALADVLAESHEPNHARAVRALLGMQKRRSLIVWITDFAETATVPEVIEYAMQMTPRHLVVFAAMNQPELAALAAATPTSTEEMYRHAAALEICQRRDLLLRRLRERGILAFEWRPWELATILINQYLDVKERNLL
jgi:uncharacterized protein (DUF58 family)